MTDYWHLRKSDWLATVPVDAASTLRQQSIRRVHEPGEVVFGPDRSPGTVYLLEDGLIRLYRTGADGGEYTVDYVRPRELFGEVSVVADRPRESFAEARHRSSVLHIPRRAFLAVIKSSAAALYQITKKMGRTLLTCRSRAEDLAFRDVRARLAHLFLRLGEEFGKPTEEGIDVALPLTQQELASLVGATRQTVSGALAELVEAGALERRPRAIVLRDRQALHQLADLPPSD